MSSTNSSEEKITIEERSIVSDHIRRNAGSSFLAYSNVVCVVAGTGTLGLPYALRLGGWIGLLILFLSWAMSIYTGILIIRCLYASKQKERLSTYREIATACFGKIGGGITFFFNAWILLGAPILYMVLSGSNINFLCKETSASSFGSVNWTIVSCAIVALPFILVKSMKEVAWMSAMGALATLIVVFIVMIVAGIDKSNTVPHHDAVIWHQFPIALSTIAFSFGGNVVYPHVEASMKKPNDWAKVVAAGLSTCAVLYFLSAIPGYYVYGTDVLSPVYNSLPNGIPKTIAIVVMTFHVLTAAPILVTSFALDVEQMLNITVEKFGKVKEFLLRAMIRMAIMVFVGFVGSVVPHFDDLMALIGAFANCVLIFIFPIVFYYRLTGFRNKSIGMHLWCFLTVLMGLIGLIFGTIEAIKALVRDFQ